MYITMLNNKWRELIFSEFEKLLAQSSVKGGYTEDWAKSFYNPLEINFRH